MMNTSNKKVDKSEYSIPSELVQLQALLFDPLQMHLDEISKEEDGRPYLAYRFTLNGQPIIFRKAKITPTKAGQFVTLWKRDPQGISCPWGLDDQFSKVIILARKGTHWGIFVFSKELLHQHGIVSGEGSEGKRGFRIYPPWDTVASRQATSTQAWQSPHFVELSSAAVDIGRVRELFTILPVGNV